MMKTKKWMVLVLCLALVVVLAGCGSSGSKWSKYLGKWTDETTPTRQIEIKANGDSFIMTYIDHVFLGSGIKKGNYLGPEIKTADYIVKPSGEVLSVSAMGIEVPVILDPKTDKLSFDNRKYHRQSPEDVKKMEELEKRSKE